MLHRLYFSPGMFGFGRLASYDYFVHIERGLAERFAREGHEIEAYILDVPPTASVRRRAVRLAELIARTCDPEGVPSPIHIVGHSTGGLDARLVASPDVHLSVAAGAFDWLPRLASITMMNTPHFGTPLASFFATVSGQRMLHALSALTFVGLAIGTPPLAAASSLVVAIGRIDRTLGVQVRALDSTTDALLRVLDANRGREVRAYLHAIKEDQGAVIQLMPEAMDLFQAGIANRPGVLYQSIVSMATPASPGSVVRALTRPWRALSATLFATIHGITARFDERYPCAAPNAGIEAEAVLRRAFGRAPGLPPNDGVVPLRSQLWGRIAWAGYADHLDTLGHFDDDRGDAHIDWFASGSEFGRTRFSELLDAMAAGMLEASVRVADQQSA